MTITYIFLPPGTTNDLLELAAKSEVYQKLWLQSIKAALLGPERERFLTLVTRHRDALHALAAITMDPTALSRIIEEDNTIRHMGTTWREDSSMFCPIWAHLFYDKTGSAHDAMTLRAIIGDSPETPFWSWALKHAQRVNPHHNREWVNRFLPHGLKEEKKRRKAKSQRARGRVLDNKGA